MFHATIKGGKLSFGPVVLKHLKDWFADNEGKRVVVHLEKPTVSNELRGYYFGAVIPFVKTLVTPWENLSDDQMHEILKQNFNGFRAFNPLTQTVERFGQSIMSGGGTSERAREYIRAIEEWVLDNYGRHLPDPEKYKQWRDSAPIPGEKYNGD